MPRTLGQVIGKRCHGSDSQNRRGGHWPPRIVRCVRRLPSARPRATLAGSAGRHCPRRHGGATLDARQFVAVELIGHHIAAAAHHSTLGHCAMHALVPLLPGHWLPGHRRHRCTCHRHGGCGGRCRRFGCGRRGHWGLRPDRCGDRKCCSDRDAIQEMLHASVLCGSSGLDNTLQKLAHPRAALADLGSETIGIVASFPRTRNSRCYVSDLTGNG